MKMARKIELSAEETMQAVNWKMPIYNRVCSECGALCFDDDSFCAECGVHFSESEQKHGRWIDKGEYAVCTECGGHSGTQYDGLQPVPLMTQFCPHCGIKMNVTNTNV